MKNNIAKKDYTGLKFVILLFGFPIILLYAIYKSIPVFEANYSYLPYIFAGVGLLVGLAILYYLAVLITGTISKVSGKNTVITICTIILALFATLFTSGTWLLADKYLPPIINNATQSTITYDQLKENYLENAIIHADLLTGFIEMNVNNGRLSPEKADVYAVEGYGNEEVRNLIENSYNSISIDGYENFNGMLVGMADGGRLTIPILIHLLFDERNKPTYGFENYVGEGRGEEGKNLPIGWSVLDLQGGVMTFSLDVSGLLSTEYTEIIDWVLPALFGESGMVETLLNSIESAIASEELVGSPIYISIDYSTNTLTISIESTNNNRGVYDYKSMAWLYNNTLLVALISVFPIRNALYLLGGLVVLTTICLGIVRQNEYGKKSKEGKR